MHFLHALYPPLCMGCYVASSHLSRDALILRQKTEDSARVIYTFRAELL